jgi:hypothetical protein
VAGELGDLDVAVDGAQVLDQVCAALRWFVKFQCAEAADAAALHVAVTHAAASLQVAPRLRVKSPTKRCGKSRLLEVESWLVRNPLKTVNISAAALVRSIDASDPPTIVFDEMDATFGRNSKGDEKAEALRGILNGGFDRNQPYVRWDVTTRSLDQCPTFALAILAGIGDLPDTIEDRSIPIVLHPKTKAETCTITGQHTGCPLVHRFKGRRDVPQLCQIRDRLAAWMLPRAEWIGAGEPVMPPGLNDRAEDIWEPLVSLADLAGGTWPQRARQAARVLCAEAELDAGESMRLLTDLWDVFARSGWPQMPSEMIVHELWKIEEAPWGDWFGHPLNQRELAKLLRPFGIRPKAIRIGESTPRGYTAADLWDAWVRYVPEEHRSGGGTATS